jgi:hypothetical protein
MSISSVGGSTGVDVSALRMGELLKNITKEQIGMDNKLLKVVVAEKVSNTGHNIDLTA